MTSYRSSVTFESDTKPCVTIRGPVAAFTWGTGMSRAMRLASRHPEVKGKVWRSAVCVLERVDGQDAPLAPPDKTEASS